MGIGAKMPAVRIYRFKLIGPQDLVIGTRFTVWSNIAIVPIMFSQRYLAEIAVAVEKHMPHAPAF